MTIENKLDDTIVFDGAEIKIPIELLKKGKYLEVSVQIITDKRTGKRHLDITGNLPHSDAYLDIEKEFDKIDNTSSLKIIDSRLNRLKSLFKKNWNNLYNDEQRSILRQQRGIIAYYQSLYNQSPNEVKKQLKFGDEKEIISRVGKNISNIFPSFNLKDNIGHRYSFKKIPL
ncbi:MAG: hypothetical protein KKF48_02160 [Nanoarchaeota archaeon]|nr:hypothetical protein [Nanoarchaeota archaeon]MBU1027824.1 hypothetical protein [Nanoarchaeota archaeon]